MSLTRRRQLDDAAAAARLSARTSPVAPTTPAVRRPGQQVQVQPRGVRVEGDADPQKRREQRRRPGRGCCDGPPFYWKKPFGDARSGRHRRAPSSGDGPCAVAAYGSCAGAGPAGRFEFLPSRRRLFARSEGGEGALRVPALTQTWPPACGRRAWRPGPRAHAQLRGRPSRRRRWPQRLSAGRSRRVVFHRPGRRSRRLGRRASANPGRLLRSARGAGVRSGGVSARSGSGRTLAIRKLHQGLLARAKSPRLENHTFPPPPGHMKCSGQERSQQTSLSMIQVSITSACLHACLPSYPLGSAAGPGCIKRRLRDGCDAAVVLTDRGCHPESHNKPERLCNSFL